jgi:hypothetical protein
MTTRVSQPQTVSINGSSYRLADGTHIHRQPTGQYAQKIVIGDYGRDSHTRTSVVTWSDFRGGIGLERISGPEDFNRAWSSSLQLWYNGHLIIPILQTETANLASGTGTVTTIGHRQSSSNSIMATWDNNDVRAYNNSTDSWGSSLDLLGGTATDVLSSFRMPDDTEYIAWAFTSGYTYYDGSSFNDSAKATKYLAFWDNRLWGIDNTGQLWFSHIIGTETDDAKLPLPDGYVSRLFVGPDAGGERILYAATVDGLWAHDVANARFVETDMKFPRHQHGGLGATTWNGLIYLSAGMAVYEYNPRAGIVRSMGLDRESGVESGYKGEITQLVSTQIALIARSRGGYVWGWNGTGWQRVTAGKASGVSALADAIHISSAYDKYRLWYVAASGSLARIRYLPFPSEIQNPSEDSMYFDDAGAGAYFAHIFPWFDGFDNEVDKLALRLYVEVTGTSSTSTVRLSYRTEYSAVGESTQLGSTITSDGVTVFTFQTGGVNVGLNFNSIQFIVGLDRTVSSNTSSPDIRRISFEYRKKTPSKWSFTIDIDHSNNVEGVIPEGQLDNLRSAIESNILVELTYRDRDDNEENYFVEIVAAEMIEQTGNAFEGITRIQATEL